MLSPRKAGGANAETELLMYMASKTPQLGSGRIQVHAVAGDAKPMGYFRGGRDFGYDLKLYPSLCARTINQAHDVSYLHMLPIEADAAKRAAAVKSFPSFDARKLETLELGALEATAISDAYTSILRAIPMPDFMNVVTLRQTLFDVLRGKLLDNDSLMKVFLEKIDGASDNYFWKKAPENKDPKKFLFGAKTLAEFLEDAQKLFVPKPPKMRESAGTVVTNWLLT